MQQELSPEGRRFCHSLSHEVTVKIFLEGAVKKNNSKSPLLRDDQLHADNEFYANLPFNKYKNPPKEVNRRNTVFEIITSYGKVVDVDDDNLDYADCDYLDIYANGPLKYREASQKNASLRKKKLEDRKAVKSSFL